MKPMENAIDIQPARKIHSTKLFVCDTESVRFQYNLFTCVVLVYSIK